MSAPAPRAPAPARRAAGAYLRLLGHGWTIAGVCLGVLHASDSDREWMEISGGPFDDLRGLALLMFFLPLLHWRGQGGRRAMEASVPLERTKHELVRVGCGTAWAAVTLGMATAVHVWQVAAFYPEDPHTFGGFPHWYPVSLFAAGITLYLLGSAVLLRSERPGRVVVLLNVLGGIALSLLPAGTWLRLVVPERDPGDLARLGTPEWVGGAALGLGLACAAVYASVRLDLARVPGWAWTVERFEKAARWRLDRGSMRRSRGAPVRAARVRRPPSTLVVAREQFMLLRRRMAWPLLIALLLAWRGAGAEMEAGRVVPTFAEPGPGGADAYGFLAGVALFWPLLVWIDERNVPGERDEALPVGTTKRRILHAVAGATWLLLAVLVLVAGRMGGAMAAGTLASPADAPPWLWPGLPCSVLTLYLFGTVAALLVDSPVMGGFVSTSVMGFASMFWREGPLAPDRVLGPFWVADPRGWGYPAALFWLALCAAAATGAITLSAWRDRNGRFPGVSDVRRFLRSWTRVEPDAAPAHHGRAS